jgi:transcriptional regulator with XRE-family HTH domain
MKMQRSKQRVSVSVGDSVRIMRELQELSQNQLAQLTGIPQSTISAIERDRVNLGVILLFSCFHLGMCSVNLQREASATQQIAPADVVLVVSLLARRG